MYKLYSSLTLLGFLLLLAGCGQPGTGNESSTSSVVKADNQPAYDRCNEWLGDKLGYYWNRRLQYPENNRRGEALENHVAVPSNSRPGEGIYRGMFN